MNLKIDLDRFRIPDGKAFRIDKAKSEVKCLYHSTAHYERLIAQFREEIDELQQKMYAQDRYALLLVFQAMDAAGKDSTIKHVMSGVNPQGIEVHAFDRPTQSELDHDYLWRTTRVMPPRGRIGIFNRSYYEEVLVCRVHPEIVTGIQRLPKEAIKDMNARLGLPSGLAEMGVTRDMFGQIIQGAMADHCHKTNPRIATEQDYEEMLAASM